MLIAVPKEITAHENRVALTPQHTSVFSDMGYKIQIQSGAGQAAGFDDDEYENAGAKICSTAKETFRQADIILKIWAPEPKEAALLNKNQTVICNGQNIKTYRHLEQLAQKDINLFCLDLIPRISRAQDMDILSSQNNLAGYEAVIIGAAEARNIMPLLITSAGTLPPMKILILGLGIAGLQAAATAHRLGAQIYAADIRPETEEQAASIGAVFVHQITPDLLSSVQIVICSALTQGKQAPRLLTEEQISYLPDGCVIIDMAADSGGNIPSSKLPENIKLIADSHLARRIPHSASILYSGNMFNFCRLLMPEQQFNPDSNDEIIAAATVCRQQKINHPYLQGK